MSRLRQYVLAIDQGTTGSTVLILDQLGRVAGKGYSEITQHFPKPGWVEHDAEEIWNATFRVITCTLKTYKIDPAQINSIGITNQRETSLVWDRKTGRPYTRAIVWQDRRTSALCRELKEEMLETGWQKRTGLLIDPYFSATKLHWMLENVKGLKASARRGDAAFGTIDSWLVWKLTGGSHHITDYSNASRTMLFNIQTLKWDREILSRLDIPESLLPSVCASSKINCHTDPDIFFGKRIPIAGIAGDQQAALFGQSCFHPGTAKNTYGTGSFLLMNTGKKPIVSSNRLLSTIAWKIGNDPVEYAIEGSIFITGAAIQWLRDGLGIIAKASETEKMALSIAGNDNLYFVPALTGLGAPYWDPYARGLIIGLTRGTGRNHIARAALESICYQTRDVALAMEKDSGIRLKELRADGGAVSNKFLMQFQSDILGVPVYVPDVAETTAKGAAYMAGLATGFWPDKEHLAGLRSIHARYLPGMSAGRRQKLYSRWKEAVERARSWDED